MFELILIGALFVPVLWLAIFMRWRWGLYGLLLYLPFAGAVALLMSPNKAPLLFKDIFFVIPAYISFFVFHIRDLRPATVPGVVLGSMLALAALVLIQTMNPGVASLLVAAIGVKVWLFYMPLMFLAAAAINTPEDLLRILRLLLVVAVIPCAVGLIQWVASATIGHEAAITAFYGRAAAGATQRFAQFDYGGAYYRIPSTFTFNTQYWGFTLSMLVPPYILSRIDPSPRWRRFAWFMFGFVIAATLLSGSRSAIFFVPILILLMYLTEGRATRFMAAVATVPIVMFTVLYLAGIDPLMIVGATATLTGRYMEGIVIKGLLDALAEFPWGQGTGMSTNAARYVIAGQMPELIENYYAKAVVELGFVGLLAVLALFSSIILAGYRIVRRMTVPALKCCAAAFVAFFVTIAINSGKGWIVDLDPINVYFWIFAGILFKLPHLEAVPVVRRQPQPLAVRGMAVAGRRST
ncbi:MAG: hypothetical protein IIA72_05505 [Proteobacteria bacterium]|nr:hypothetical protein [Pseudomonadota bacterium]